MSVALGKGLSIREWTLETVILWFSTDLPHSTLRVCEGSYIGQMDVHDVMNMAFWLLVEYVFRCILFHFISLGRSEDGNFDD